MAEGGGGDMGKYRGREVVRKRRMGGGGREFEEVRTSNGSKGKESGLVLEIESTRRRKIACRK